MEYTDRQKLKKQLSIDIEEIKSYQNVDDFIDTNFQMSSVYGEYDDNTLDLNYKYKMLKEIHEDDRFMHKLDFILIKYINRKLK